MQVGVIVAGVLASGIWHKFATNGVHLPNPVTFLYSHGTDGFAVPIIWLVSALSLYSQEEVSDELKDFAFWGGVMLLIGLVVFVVYANVSPALAITWSLSGGDGG